MQHEAVSLIRDGDRTLGVQVRTPDGEFAIHADLVVACDGRASTLREAAGLRVRDLGAPMDVLWFRLPRGQDAPDSVFGIVDAGHMMILLDRGDYWQAAFVVPKGSDARFRAQPVDTLREAVVRLAPFLTDAVGALQSWDDVKTLEVHVNRLRQWHRSGLLLIGDAAHAMSPVGGVGINLAIQDAVAAANVLAPAWVAGKRIDTALLQRVQKRRLLPVRLVQALQLQVQKRLISRLLEDASKAPRMPVVLRWLLRFRAVRHIPARLIGYGFHREHVRSGKVSPGTERETPRAHASK
jgi:2-polyprenyl-6-methoxyphenol hydroxylase-like FAD-dependent oxidoreductase